MDSSWNSRIISKQSSYVFYYRQQIHSSFEMNGLRRYGSNGNNGWTNRPDLQGALAIEVFFRWITMEQIIRCRAMRNLVLFDLLACCYKMNCQRYYYCLVVFLNEKRHLQQRWGRRCLFYLHENAVIKKSIDYSTQFTLMDIPNWGNKPQFHILSLNVLLSYAITQLYNFLSLLAHKHILNLK